MVDFMLSNSVSNFSLEELAELHPEATISRNGRSGLETLKYTEKKMRVKTVFDKKRECYVTSVAGSLHRYHTRQSYSSFPFSSIKPALECLCKNCDIDMKNENWLYKIEIGVNLHMNCDPDDYLSMFKLYKGKPFVVMKTLDGENRPHGIERKMAEDYYRIKIYNKTIYARTVEKLSPPDNILRVEVAFHASGISKLGLPNTMNALMDRERFQMYVDKFREIIYGIAMVDCAPAISGLKGKDLREYYFMHRNQRVYSEYLGKIEGDKKRLAAERKKYDRINAILASAPNLKSEFFEKFETEIEHLMTARYHTPPLPRLPRKKFEPTHRKRAPIRTIR